MSLPRRLLLCALTGLLIATVVIVGLRAVLPAAPPPLPSPEAPAHGPLTRHLALIVVDGLRLDVAEDPSFAPTIAEGMRRHTSGEFWAGEVTMTSSTLLAWSTGQYGGLEHIIFNETARPTELDHWLGAAKRAGLLTAVAGDRAWIDQFPGAWDEMHPDPAGVSMEVDYSPEIFGAVYRFLERDPPPNLLVAHFVPPDHMGHVHGIFSEGYRQHLRGFDVELAKLLAAFSADWTVFVTSDHGMTAPGTHGSSTPEQRRTGAYAYGPGIRSRPRGPERFGHADLAATFARLLGLPSPTHSVGHVVADWLDLPESERARVGCDELERIGRFAAASGLEGGRVDALRADACRDSPTPDDVGRAREGSERIAEAMRGEGAIGGGRPWLVLAIGALGGLGLAAGWRGRLRAPHDGRWLVALALFALLAVVSIWLTREVERLPGFWPNRVRVPLFVLANAALLVIALRLRRTADWIDRHTPIASSLLLGLLVVSYTKNTQAETYVIFATCCVVLLAPAYARWQLAARATWLVTPWRALLALAFAAAGGFIGFEAGYAWPEIFLREPAVPRALALLAIALFAVDRALARPGEHTRRRDVALTAALALVACGSLWLRSAGSVVPSLAGWIIGPIAAVLFWRRGRRSAAELALLATYGLVSRDAELLTLLPSIFVAETLGAAIAALLAGRGAGAARGGPESGAGATAASEPRHAAVLGIVTLIFAMAFVQRVGIQLSLDFPSFDWAAGTFGEGGVSLWRIGAGIVTKHCLALGAIVLALLAPLGPALRARVAQGMLLVELGRTLVLIAMLFECRASFWTVFRVLGDLPHAFMGIGIATVACAFALGPARKSLPVAQPLEAAA